MAIAKVADIATVNNAATLTSVVTVGAAGVSAGELIVLRLAAIGTALAGTFVSATDSKGNAYAIVSTKFYVTRNVELAIIVALCVTPLVNGDTITVTLATSRAMNGVASRFSGVAATTDGSSSSGAFANLTWTAGSIVTTNANDLLLVAASDGSATATADVNTVGNAFTQDFPGTTLTKGAFYGQYRIASSTGTYTGGGTLATSNNIAAAFVALKASGAAAAPIPDLIMAPPHR